MAMAPDAKQGEETPAPASDAAAQQPSGFGTLERIVKAFTVRLVKMFGGDIDADPRGFKKRAVQIFRRNLPPFVGRPTEQVVTAAATLHAATKSWREIYPAVIPNHAAMDPATRRQAESNLRSAIRSRRNARKRRKRSVSQ